MSFKKSLLSDTEMTGITNDLPYSNSYKIEYGVSFVNPVISAKPSEISIHKLVDISKSSEN